MTFRGFNIPTLKPDIIIYKTLMNSKLLFFGPKFDDKSLAENFCPKWIFIKLAPGVRLSRFERR
jgi:hypothetical protein